MNDKGQKGFTLIEVLLSIVLLGIIASVMVGMLRFYQNSFLQNRNDTTAFEDVNMAMQMMVREIRQGSAAQLSPKPAAPTPANLITSMNSNTVTILLPSGTYVTYHLNGAQLMRNSGSTAVGGNDQMVVPNVANNGLNFTITARADPNNISTVSYTVQINLTVQGNAADNKFRATVVNLVDLATLRN